MAKSGDKYVLRLFNIDKDYELYKSWWNDPPPIESLPRIGMVIGDMKAVGFLAMTDCNFSIFTWWCANPQNKGRESYKSLKRLIQCALDASRAVNKKYVFCYTNERGMIKLLESQNFKNNSGHLIVEVL